jgi:hypothetical protein
LRGDEGVDVLFDIGRAPGLAALGELDRPSRPMGRLRGLIGRELKPRRLDRPMIGGVLERSQPIAALDLRAGKLLTSFIRTQRRLARFAEGGDRAIDERLSIAFNAARRSFGSAGKSVFAIVSAIARSALLRPSGSGASNPNASAMSSTSGESGATSTRRSIDGFALCSTGNRITLLPRVMVS